MSKPPPHRRPPPKKRRGGLFLSEFVVAFACSSIVGRGDHGLAARTLTVCIAQRLGAASTSCCAWAAPK
eukprot:4303481-Amphidinium_carterae.1